LGSSISRRESARPAHRGIVLACHPNQDARSRQRPQQLLVETMQLAVTGQIPAHSQLHGLYQQLLRALAASGVLVGVASKNDPAVAGRALSRRDMLLPKESVFPIEVNWDAKSKSAERILKAWNIAADSVVFVDDSAMEVAEVKAAWPEMECLLFPVKIRRVRKTFCEPCATLFGKSHLGAEDSLRLESLRRSAEFQTGAEGSAGAPEQFLAQAGATMTIEFNPPASEARVAGVGK